MAHAGGVVEKRGIPRVSANLVPSLPDATVSGVQLQGPAGATAGASGPVRLDVVLQYVTPGLAQRIAAAGGTVRVLSSRYRRASVVATDGAAIERIAALPEVQYIYPDYGAAAYVGSVDSRAVAGLDATPIVDGSMAGLTGAGQRIGILSDSFARTDAVRDAGTTPATCMPGMLKGAIPQVSGDLPTQVEIRADNGAASGGTVACPNPGDMVDEGAAMAELAHDIAPGAAISFHTAMAGGFAGYAEAIDDLCTARPAGAGATVVVDDIRYLAELMYQPDIVTQAVERCVANGVSYFSAVGNNAGNALHEVYRDLDPADDDDGRNNGKVIPLKANDLHDWGGGDPFLAVTIPRHSTVTAVLQWNQPALSVPQNAGHGPMIDLDLYALAWPAIDAPIVDREYSVNDQRAGTENMGADPIEVVALNNVFDYPVTRYLVIDHWAGAQDSIPQDPGTPLEFRLVFYGTDRSGVQIEHITTAPHDQASTLYGHGLADGAVAVGAVPWFDAPAFDPGDSGWSPDIDPEPFSAMGGYLERHFAADGHFERRTSGLKPDLAAVDGNNTTFFPRADAHPWTSEDGEDDGFPNFFGTSAAAPNAAAIAALLREDDPVADPAMITARLKAGAVDVTGARAAPGCDVVSGAGLIDAANARTAVVSTPVAAAGPDGSAQVGDMVRLDGSASRDAGSPLQYRWTQVAGARAPLNDPADPRPHFVAPDRNGTLVYELRVQDGACLSAADTVAIDVSGAGSGGGAFGGAGLLLGLLAAAVRRSRRAARRTAGRAALRYDGAGR